MIFAGLFSATITAFILESSKRLFQDPNDRIAALLGQVVIQLAANNNKSLPVIQSPPPFIPAASAIAVNILWFLSLACSLAAALCVTLVQQWIRDYLQRVERHSQPQRRARIRGFFAAGIEKWKMAEVVEFIPTLLHISLFLFFVGLCIFLGPGVDQVVMWTVVTSISCCFTFYVLVTIAPLIDASAPYQTTASPFLWRILRRAECLHSSFTSPGREGIQANLEDAREELALHQVDALGPSRECDSQALRWVFERIRDDWELERFVESIPGLLHSKNGRFIWHNAFRNLHGWVEVRILSLLKSTRDSSGSLDRQLTKRRASMCTSALAAISFPLDPSQKRWRPSPAHWDEYSNLHSKDFSAPILAGHRALLISGASDISLPSRQDIRNLSRRADTSLQAVSELQQILEAFVERYKSGSEPCSPADVSALLQVAFGVLESSSRDLVAWMDSMRYALHHFQSTPLLSSYNELPRVGLQLTYREIPLFPRKTKIFLHAYQVLAHLKPDTTTSHSSSPDSLSSMWLQAGSSSTLGVEEIPPFPSGPESFMSMSSLHELDVLLSILKIVTPISMTSNQMKYSPRQDSNKHGASTTSEKPYSLHLLMSVVPQGPFSTFASILEDIGEGGVVSSLLEFVLAIKRRPPTQEIQISFVSETLKILYEDLEGIHMSETSQVLFVGVLHEILLFAQESIFLNIRCPFSSDDVTFLIKCLDGNLTYESSVEFAAHMLQNLVRDVLEDGKIKAVNHIADTNRLSEMGASARSNEEAIAARGQTIYGHVAAKWRLWRRIDLMARAER
ncbi:hypothetical protein DXG01_016491 [Tephrocybe rancida]|nr:hypothetical protein DXG01_016491 [Tephrocybe rancida]